MVCCCGDVFDHSRRFFGGMNRACLRRNQLWNADQVVGDQIEHEVGSDAKDAAMLGLAHGAMLLTPAKDAFYHRAARLRPAALLLALSMISEARRAAVPLACVTMPATANPCRFSMVTCPI